jgi:hypothetical protein
VHSNGSGVGPHELVVTENEIGPAGDPVRVIGMDGHLQTERLAVLARVGGARRVRRDEQRSRPSAPNEPQRTFAEGRSVDEEIAALAVVNDVLALVFERFVQLEDPRTELMNIHGAGLS